MKRLLTLCLLLACAISCKAQFGISAHQSELASVGFNYQINRFLPELRVGTDIFLENLPLELNTNFIVKKTEEADVYLGLGIRYYTGYDEVDAVIPLGVNIYPFPKKNFGFHVEISALPSDEILRGLWGIRYRFNK